MRGENKNLWRRLSETFVWLDSKYGHPPYHNRLMKEVFSSVLNKKDRIIDIGCGAGGLSIKLAQIVTGGEVVGIDVLEGYIRKLNRFIERDKPAPKNLTFRLGSAENIPYPDSYFDHAIVSESFGFWDRPEKGLAEVNRVLKLSGEFYVINSYKGAPAWVRIGVKSFNLFSASKEELHTSQEYREFFERAGFTVVAQKEIMGASLMTVGTKG